MKLLDTVKTAVSLGHSVEAKAADFLKQQGLRIIKKNYRCKGGEIDIIAQEGANLVFVEVRYRKSSRFGTPGETVTRKKQQRVIKAAKLYLLELKELPPCRFDVIEGWPGSGTNVNFNWIQNAFSCQ